ncbi:Monofunctional C1-tetrahydrofolate synthase, mitochondrial [Lonchura striata]|uniref:formate--tetrahydrofolate ligase n=1 Tax=Lonchura striata TaxID=40157 RepID=A0A218V705_9PASE|nr:Monofunctional C1-tetrahydrofolate synthase, mitochondrial [Lonchura striata domestica]
MLGGFILLKICLSLCCSKVTDNAKNSLASLKRENPRLEPTLAIIQAHNDQLIQEANKNFAKEIGLRVIHICLPEGSTKDEIVSEILRLNEDPNVQGLALDLPESLYSSKILNAVKPEKDVDGLSSVNLGCLVHGDVHDCLVPPTVCAVMELLEDIGGKKVLLVGARGAEGAALQSVLQRQGATVLSCHWKAPQLQSELRHADTVVFGTAKPDDVPVSWIKPGATLINCAHDPLSEKHSYGQQNNPAAEKTVGSLAVAMRMQNMVKNMERWIQSQQYRKWNLHSLKLQPLSPVPSDIEISRAQSPKAVDVLAKEIGLLTDEIEIFGQTKAKVRLSLLERLKDQPDGKYVLVAGLTSAKNLIHLFSCFARITPTPLGEGKSTVTVGLVQALTAHLNINSFACLRQPSQGPTFGVKGGAAGGGYAQVIPMEEFNLHLTGDIHAITAANNLLAAAIDARILHENTQSDKSLYNRLVPVVNGVRGFSAIQLARLRRLGIHKTDPEALTEEEISKFVRLDIDPSTITWQRVVDTNDRFLRKITVGQANTEKGFVRQVIHWGPVMREEISVCPSSSPHKLTLIWFMILVSALQAQFDIAVASEIMAILALTTSLQDMKERLGRMVVANDKKGEPVTAEDLVCSVL